jgi:hypothetical protein
LLCRGERAVVFHLHVPHHQCPHVRVEKCYSTGTVIGSTVRGSTVTGSTVTGSTVRGSTVRGNMVRG